jgi:hypothetical protein
LKTKKKANGPGPHICRANVSPATWNVLYYARLIGVVRVSKKGKFILTRDDFRIEYVFQTLNEVSKWVTTNYN